MKIKLFGFGLGIHKHFIGGAPGVPIHWSWCLTVYWRSPRRKDEGGAWLWWRAKYFYGREHVPTVAECFAHWRYVCEVRQRYGPGTFAAALSEDRPIV